MILHSHECACLKCHARMKRDARMNAVVVTELRARLDLAVRRDQIRRGEMAMQTLGERS